MARAVGSRPQGNQAPDGAKEIMPNQPSLCRPSGTGGPCGTSTHDLNRGLLSAAAPQLSLAIFTRCARFWVRKKILEEKRRSAFMKSCPQKRLALRQNNVMHHKLSTRQRVVCCIIAFCTAIFYVGLYFYTCRAEWQAHEGDRPPIPLWFQNGIRDLFLFPFGFLPALYVHWIFILNILFWSAASVLIYVLLCRRKNAGS
jgi:hypothetical protein